MVDEVAPYHAEFTRALRAAHGKVLAKGRPRITRFRPGASCFTLVGPSGNSIIFIQRDEPTALECGGSKSLTGLAGAIDKARICNESENGDRTARRVLATGRRKHVDTAPAVGVALALASLIELATALEETGGGERYGRLNALDLTDGACHRVAG
ncbi:hypothetical protein [Streptomyces erythrochromogenes]|uniref:hypothetical protein n=1 Tax=Streptomyces erythrochromogenes TaxID=285574 RepID=UPI0036AF9EE3